MADREKIVRAVETCFDSWIDKHRNIGLDLHEVERMKRDALELLEDDETQLIYRDEIIKAHEDEIERLNKLLKEQEPIMPKQQEETRVWTVCGNCSQHLISKWIYCPYCGRKVKWDG